MSSEPGAGTSPYAELGSLIDDLRQERGLSLEALGGSEFSHHYLQALIRGLVAPSHITLALLERRLEIEEGTLQDLAKAAASSTGESLMGLDMLAQEEDLTCAFNTLRHQIGLDQVGDALNALDQLEVATRPYRHMLPPRMAYQFPFVRARAAIQQLNHAAAIRLLREALTLAGPEPEASAQVHNMLGAVYYGEQQQRLALQEHLAALDYVQSHPYRNLPFSLAVYQNLANDYMVLGYSYQAVNAYKRALELVEHVDASPRKASLYWGLAETYRKMGRYVQAMTCGLQARDVYTALVSNGEAAAVLLNLSEMLIDNGRYLDAEGLLKQSSVLLAAVDHPGLSAYLCLYTARLHRERGNMEQAFLSAAEGIRCAEKLSDLTRSGADADDADDTLDHAPLQPWISPPRAVVETTLEAALVEVASGRLDSAASMFERALADARQSGLEDLHREVAHSYALQLQSIGKDAEAAVYLSISTL